MSTNCPLKKPSRKPFEYIQNYKEETSSVEFQKSTAIISNGLLRDYEIVTSSCVQQVEAHNDREDGDEDDDEDDDEDEDFVVAYDKVLPSDNELADEGDENQAAALPQSQSEEFIKHLRHASNGDGQHHKLSLALSAEKISLKASPKIDKTMDPTPSTSYTVVPISFRSHKEPPVSETERFPSRVLKSFASAGERRATGAAATSNRAHNNHNQQQHNNGSFKRKTGGKVTFHTRGHPSSHGAEAVIDTPDIVSGGNLPPMTDDEINEQMKQPPTTTTISEENASNSSEMVSQFGSSTSPESIMDNILSAASSVSLRSSSLSSSNTASHMEEAAKLLVASMFTGGEVQVHNRTPSKSATTKGSITPLTLTPTRQQQQARTPTPSPPLPPPPLTQPPAVADKASVSPPLPPPPPSLLPPPPSLLPPSPSPPLPPAPHPPPPPAPHPPRPPHPTSLASQYSLQPPAMQGDSNRSRSPSPSPSVVIRLPAAASSPPPVPVSVPEELKCPLCGNFFTDPRTLHCLHSFCFQCLVDENFKQDQSIPFWSQPSEVELNAKAGSSKASGRSVSPEMSLRSASDASTQPPRSYSPLRRRGSSFSFRRKKSQERLLTKGKATDSTKSPSTQLRLAASASDERSRVISCKTCQYQTPLPIGGIRQLPQNFLLVRRIEQHKVQSGEEVIANVWCSLCFEETNATYHCIACTLNLCSLCKEAHERQRSTANHKIKNIMELRRAKKQKQSMLDDNSKFALKCGMHPGYEMKSFCTNCLEVACPDCLVLLHKGHKYETINRAIGSYGKILRESIEQTRPLCNYAEHSIERLNDIAKGIQRRCDDIQASVEQFLVQYFEALEVHRRTLLQQITRARESKVEMILEQQLDLERRNTEAVEALRFGQDLSDSGSDVEILSFLSILLKRFEYCQQFKAPVDPKISDSLHFLPEIRAPSNKHQNHIPLYGIITMQTVEPSLCTLQLEGSTQLRLHKRVELIMESRDSDGVALCHGGLQIKAQIKYKEYNSKFLPIEVSDHRDGTYVIAFTPDSQGNLILTLHINEKPIKGSPFTFQARMVRPHSGIFHCCAFCSSKGSKLANCSCNGRMPGYKGCGHGHAGHPGRRHWSCCGNVLENSECNVANKLLNPENIKA